MRVAAVLLLLAVAVSAPEARGQADGGRRVVVLLVDHDPQLKVRLAAELRAQGFEPVDAAPEAELTLLVEISPTVIHLSIANTFTGRKIEREALLGTTTQPDSAIVSLWAVEALRASLVAPAPAPAGVVVAPAPAPAKPWERPTALWLGPAVALGLGGMGTAAQVMIGARRRLTRHAGVELFMDLPTFPTRLERASGSASVSQGTGAVGMYLAAGRDDARWSAQLGAGAALAVIRVSGSGAEGYLGRVDHVTAGGPYARLGGALRLTRAFRLRLDGVLGALFPQPTIFFAEERVAAWGRPWMTAAMAGEVTF
jgi:hypothetical protein